MDEPVLRIALISPHAFPPGDDVGRAVQAEADALARRGHAVTILAPGTGRAAVDAGRRRIDALEVGDDDAISPAPGAEPLFVATSRALRGSGPGRRLGGPIDAASGLEVALSMGRFDVAHLHEPLAPSPALNALRHATGVRAVTFHRTAPLAGVAFVRPLVDRALAQADIRVAESDAAQHVLKRRARVKPDFQNIGALGVLLGVVTRLAQDVFHRGTAPGLDAALRHHIRRLVQDGHGAGMQFAAVFVQQKRHRHAPAALPRNAPVGPVGNHVAQTGFAVLRVKLGVLNRIQRQLTQRFGRFVCGEHAHTFIHANKPLRRRAVDDRCFVAPAMRVTVRVFYFS